jgi:succinoglycan biosynthesis protein ExoM
VEPAPDVSICIATFRRPAGLVRLFESLARLKLPDGLAIEIVVVDNDAAGEAQAAAVAACDFARGVRWFVEPRQNIARARNRAVRAARGRWLAFVDDDEIVEEEWLAAFWAASERQESDGLFGPVLPRLEAEGVSWLDAEGFFSMPARESGRALAASDVFSGNCFLRRALFDRRGFDPAWGRTGGSDTEFFDHVLSLGARFLWCAEARVWEFVPPRRHRLAWLTQRAFRGGVGYTRLQCERRRAGAVSRGLPRALFAAGFLLPLAPLSLLAGRATSARVWLRLCTQIGHLWAFAGRSYEEYASPAPRATR